MIPNQNMNLLRVYRITKQQENNFVLRDISFIQQQFQKIAIAGETGSGKTTLLKIIGGFTQPDEGQVVFKNKKIKGPEEQLIPGHPGIAYLSQHFELRNNYRVEEILNMTLQLSDEQAETIFKVCRINHLLKRKTDQLSGGEKQRVALAGLLISSPELLLLDEPFSNLDMYHKSVLKSVIQDIGEKLRITCILVSHDPLDILSWAGQILVLKDGQIIQKGTPRQVYRQPVNEYTAGLFGTYNLITREKAKAFSTLPEVNIDGKSMLIRPEDFKIVKEGSGTLKGSVNKVNYFGSYCEVEVLLSENNITVKTDERGYSKGDTVYVSLPGDNVWYI